MSPQVPSFNRGVWQQLEGMVRKWAINEDSIFVVTGGIMTSPIGTIGTNEVTAPSEFYKIVLDLTGERKMIAFILPNQKGKKSFMDYAVSVDSVESVTGIDFFYNLPDSIEYILEGTIDKSLWGSESPRFIPIKYGNLPYHKVLKININRFLHREQSPDNKNRD